MGKTIQITSPIKVNASGLSGDTLLAQLDDGQMAVEETAYGGGLKISASVDGGLVSMEDRDWTNLDCGGVNLKSQFTIDRTRLAALEEQANTYYWIKYTCDDRTEAEPWDRTGTMGGTYFTSNITSLSVAQKIMEGRLPVWLLCYEGSTLYNAVRATGIGVNETDGTATVLFPSAADIGTVVGIGTYAAMLIFSGSTVTLDYWQEIVPSGLSSVQSSVSTLNTNSHRHYATYYINVKVGSKTLPTAMATASNITATNIKTATAMKALVNNGERCELRLYNGTTLIGKCWNTAATAAIGDIYYLTFTAYVYGDTYSAMNGTYVISVDSGASYAMTAEKL